MEKSIPRFKKKDKIQLQNKTIRKLTGMKDMRYTGKRLNWKYAGHTVTLNNDKWNKIIAKWILYGNAGNRGRLKKMKR